MRLVQKFLMLVLLFAQSAVDGSARASCNPTPQLGSSEPSAQTDCGVRPETTRCCSGPAREVDETQVNATAPNRHPSAEAAAAASHAHAAFAVGRGVRSSCCCSGCDCDVRDEETPPFPQEHAPAPVQQSRILPPESAGFAVATLPPLRTALMQTRLSAQSRETMLKAPCKRAHRSILFCAFLI
jgi:hypothetical protein